MAGHPATIDAYISGFPEGVRAALTELRKTIHTALPGAVESISYDIPTFKLHGRNVVHFAGWKEHVSLYPIPEGDMAFERAIEPYRAGKGTLRFPLGAPIPHDLVAQVVVRLAERVGG
ncbi:DUF1801 domain-containing protein [Nocardia xishanensis]|uniref:Iron chaperone n=1 Tax=Nocardia xishanensis TaxID=238964 RepID=A0ABW7WX23_9NOCA